MNKAGKKQPKFSFDLVKVGKWTFDSVSQLNPDGTETAICSTCDGDEPICSGHCWRKKEVRK